MTTINQAGIGDIQGLQQLTAGMDYQQDFSRSLLEGSSGKAPKWNGEVIPQAAGQMLDQVTCTSFL